MSAVNILVHCNLLVGICAVNTLEWVMRIPEALAGAPQADV